MTPSAPVLDQSGNKDLALLLEKMRRKAGQPALAGVVIVDGNIKAIAAVGTRKVGTENWVTIRDRFIIGSCGKAFTATLAAIIVEEGYLNWDTTLRDVFKKIPMRPEYENLRFQQLLSHRAGLVKSFLADLDSSKTFTWTSGRMAYLSQLSQLPPPYAAGEVIFYSNAGYILAGLMMEQVSGIEFMKLMSEKVFNPLGLSSAGYGPPAESERRSQPWGHYREKFSWSLKATLKDDQLYTTPAGNVVLTMEDWARFIIEHMPSVKPKSRPLLNTVTLKKLHTPEDDPNWGYDQDYFNFWQKELGWPLTASNYALGWYITKTSDGTDVLNHGGTSRAFQAVVFMSPTKRHAILLATNSRLGNIHIFRTAVAINEMYELGIKLPGEG